MNGQQVISAIRALNLPVGDYVVVGGAAMAVRGLKDTSDIDLVVTPRLFETLASSGWTLKPRPNGKPGLRHGHMEAYLDVNTEAFARSTEWLIEHAQTVDGIPLVDLTTLAGWKRSYGREKDARDVELIEAAAQR